VDFGQSRLSGLSLGTFINSIRKNRNRIAYQPFVGLNLPGNLNQWKRWTGLIVHQYRTIGYNYSNSWASCHNFADFRNIIAEIRNCPNRLLFSVLFSVFSTEWTEGLHIVVVIVVVIVVPSIIHHLHTKRSALAGCAVAIAHQKRQSSANSRASVAATPVSWQTRLIQVMEWCLSRGRIYSSPCTVWSCKSSLLAKRSEYLLNSVFLVKLV